MKHTLKTLILLSLLTLSSCVFLTENTLDQTINDNNFLNRFPTNKKAIVLLKIQGKKNERVYLCQKTQESVQNNEDCQAIYATGQYRILMLNPSIYYLFAEPKNRPIFSDIKTSEEQKYSAVLEVKSGKIIYAGDIFYKKITSIDDDGETKIVSQKLVANDNFELVQNILSGKNSKQKDKLFSNQKWEIDYLIKNYSSLQNRFEKKLIESKE